ncbi:hypothetical protein MNBD_BACTEROID05-1169 [hydrothermal vent metagenome]|uniref:Peptidase S9 prolyl oligopeptidase catalytic domain-containing protein n=1 Tax=hydrothermal vent metagenome TaxID=652676 RepID=A0A3B0TLM0_9ZZZZ
MIDKSTSDYNEKPSESRRKFIKKTVIASVGIPLMQGVLGASFNKSLVFNVEGLNPYTNNIGKSIIGGYGEWTASLLKDPPKLSFRNEKLFNVDEWKTKALNKAEELIAAPDINDDIKVVVENKYSYDGLEIEELSWQLPYGRATKAILLKPKGIKEQLPGILALHDHGGKKYFGKRKITRVDNKMHPAIEEHQNSDYEGMAWANEIAKRGYVVLVHDAFSFASRRVYYKDVEGITWGQMKVDDKSDDDPDKIENVNIYNSWAGAHETVMAKSLFCAGTTFPGMVLAEDKIALSVLSNRADVDQNRIGCGGLSGGGLRTVFLGGMDKRIKCAVCVGFMSTWKDFLMLKSYTHTWMAFAPLLSNYLDFPEILGLRVPLPTLVQSNNQDDLYTLSEMKKADNILKDVYKKAGESDKYKTNFYDGGHKFDKKMQADAFDWFDKWL